MKLGVDYRVAISTLMDSAATYSAYNVKRVRRIMIKQDFTLSQSFLIFTPKLFFLDMLLHVLQCVYLPLLNGHV